MCRIEFAEHGAVQPLIGPHGAEFHATEHWRFPLGHLDPLHPAANAHHVLPCDPVIGGEPSNPVGPPEGAVSIGLISAGAALAFFGLPAGGTRRWPLSPRTIAGAR